MPPADPHPASATAHITAPPPDLGSPLQDFVARNARAHPERIAFVCDETTLSFGELQERITRLAAALASLGVGHGDHVAVLMHNRPEYVEVIFALLTLGAAVVPVNFRFGQAELDYVLAHSDAIGVIAERRLGEAAAAAAASIPALRFHVEVDGSTPGTIAYADLLAADHDPPPPVDCDPQDTAFVMYTSGTTGRPKGAMLTHDNLLWQTHNSSMDMGLRSDDIYLSGSPLFHIAGTAGLMQYLRVGAQLIVPASSGFSPDDMIALLRRHAVTVCFFVPTQWDAICRTPGAEAIARTLRIAIWGAAPASRPLLELMDRTLSGVDVVTSFGQTEMSPSVLRLRDFNSLRKPGSVGWPTTNVEVRLVDDDGVEVGSGEVGEAVYRGPTTMKGYYRDEAATAEAFAGGWFHSGDLVRRDEEGFHYAVDRKKDMIISGGENIYPAEIEAAIVRLAGVAECSVIGTPHDRWGETPLAVIVRERDAAGAALDEPTVIAYSRERLAGYKCPSAVAFVAALPRNASGKVLKRELRERLAAPAQP